MPYGSSGRRLRGSPDGGPGISVGLTALALCGAAVVMPPPLLLPLFSLLFLTGATIVILLAPGGRPCRPAAGPGSRDVAGLLTFLGFCAALLSDPGEVLPFLQATRGK